MNEARDHQLADLLARIDAAFEHALPPIPEGLSDAARDAFHWRRVDAELAELLFDSADAELVGVRGTATERRSFRFGSHDFVIRVHLTSESMVVMIEPPLSVACRVATRAGTSDHRTDEIGELVVPAPDLPARLELDLPSGTTVTPWLTG